MQKGYKAMAVPEKCEACGTVLKKVSDTMYMCPKCLTLYRSSISRSVSECIEKLDKEMASSFMQSFDESAIRSMREMEEELKQSFEEAEKEMQGILGDKVVEDTPMPHVDVPGEKQGNSGEFGSFGAGVSGKPVSKGTLRQTAIRRDVLRNVQVAQEQLNALVMSALEVTPGETHGLAFGHLGAKSLDVYRLHPMQEVLYRDASCVMPSGFSHQRIREIQQSLGDLEFLGTFHSHPYIAPEIVKGNYIEGLGLSEGDIYFQDYIEDSELELLLSYFCWDTWQEFDSNPSDWDEMPVTVKNSKGAACQVNVLRRGMKVNFSIADIVMEIEEVLLRKIKQLQGKQKTEEDPEKLAQTVSILKQEMTALQALLRQDKKSISGFEVFATAHTKYRDTIQPTDIHLMKNL